MIAFLLLGPPLFASLLASALYGNELFPPAFRRETALGLVLGLPAVLILRLLGDLLDPAFGGWRLYVAILSTDILLPMVLFMGALFLARRRLVSGRENSCLGFGAGFFLVLGMHAYIDNIRFLDAYVLFVLPVLWMIILLHTAVFVPAAWEASGYRRWLGLLGVAAGLCLAGGASFLYKSNHPFYGWAALLAVLVAAGAIGFRMPKGR